MGIIAGTDPDLRQRSRSSAAPILGITLTIAALFQMLVYAFVVLYSLLFGGIDLVIPAKSAFLAVIFVVGVAAVDDISVAWRNRRFEPSRLTSGLVRFAIETVGVAGALLVALVFLSSPLSSIDLTHQSFDVRAFTLIGVALLLAFTGNQIRDLLRLKFRRPSRVAVAMLKGDE